MGSDKSLLPFGTYPTLVQFQYDRLSRLFSSLYISAKNREKFDFSPNVIEDPIHSDFAPTAGFVAAFEHLQSERIFVLSVDAPFIDQEIIQKLMDADTLDCDAVIAKTPSGIHPMTGIYHRSLLSELKRMLDEGDHRLGKLLSSVKSCYVEFPDEAHFSNLNRPDEYEEAVSRYNNENKLK